MDILLNLLSISFGGIIGWSIAHYYYKKASSETPEWAKDFFTNLPKEKPTKLELIKLFQEYLNNGEAIVHELTGDVACPQCGEPAENFEENYFTIDDHRGIVTVKCPECNWSTVAEV